MYCLQFLICSLSFATFAVESNLPQNRLQPQAHRHSRPLPAVPVKVCDIYPQRILTPPHCLCPLCCIPCAQNITTPLQHIKPIWNSNAMSNQLTKDKVSCNVDIHSAPSANYNAMFFMFNVLWTKSTRTVVNPSKMCPLPTENSLSRHEPTQNRLQLSFILLLTTVSFKFVVNQSLPMISYLTYLVSGRLSRSTWLLKHL